MLRCSPLESEPAPKLNRLQKIAAYLVDKLFGEPIKENNCEPVSPAALALGRFVAAHCDLGRLSGIVVTALSYERSLSQRQSVGKIFEYSSELRPPVAPRPRPTAILEVYGRGYQRLGEPDNFMCQFGVFPLVEGERYLQAVPFEYEGPSTPLEEVTWQHTLDEMFTNDPASRAKLREFRHTRINLGFMLQNGSIAAEREFNRSPLGCNIVPILAMISGPEMTENMHIEIREGSVFEYP